MAAGTAVPPAELGAVEGLATIDVHAHLFGGPRNGAFAGAVDAALIQMNRFGIRKALVMSPPRGPSIPSNFDYPEFVDSIKHHPDRFGFLGGGGALNPIIHDLTGSSAVTPAIAENFRRIALDILKAGGSGFGEISSLHLSLLPTHRYNFVPADHPLLLLLADIAAEHDVPIDLHMDLLAVARVTPARLAGNQNPQNLPATLSALVRLLQHNPKAKIVWAHGGSDQIGELTPTLVSGLMDHHANLFMSLRPVPPPAPPLNKLFSPGRIDPRWAEAISRHSDRFVIGTDSFFVPPDIQGSAAPLMFSRTNENRLSATNVFLGLLPLPLARKVAHENAVRIYKLAGD